MHLPRQQRRSTQPLLSLISTHLESIEGGGGANAQHAAPVGLVTIFSAQSTRAFEFMKDLVLEVPRFPLTCRRTLSPTSSPVARAATTKLYVLDAGFFCGDSKPIPHPQATVMPLADIFVIADEDASHNPRNATLVKDFQPDRPEQHKHRRFAHKKNFAATMIRRSKALLRGKFHTISTRVCIFAGSVRW